MSSIEDADRRSQEQVAESLGAYGDFFSALGELSARTGDVEYGNGLGKFGAALGTAGNVYGRTLDPEGFTTGDVMGVAGLVAGGYYDGVWGGILAIR